LTVVSLGWPLASVLTGRAWNALGHRRTAVMGAGFLMASGVLLATAGVRSPVWQLGAASFVMGMGLGFTQTTYIVTVQSQVPWNRRGVATSSHMFSRILGSTLWVALLGGILNQRLHARLSGLTLEGTGGPAADGIINGGTGLDMVSPLLDPAAREQMAPAVLEPLRHALAAGLHALFLVVLLTACGSFIVAFLLPRPDLVDVPDQEPHGPCRIPARRGLRIWPGGHVRRALPGRLRLDPVLRRNVALRPCQQPVPAQELLGERLLPADAGLRLRLVYRRLGDEGRNAQVLAGLAGQR